MNPTVSVLLALGLEACSTTPHERPLMTDHSEPKSDDERLVASLRAAVEARVPSTSLATRIDRKPLIDSDANMSIAALRRVDFVVDPEHPDERLSLATARTIIYWSRPVSAKDPHVVGVQYDHNGGAAVFFAIVPPP